MKTKLYDYTMKYIWTISITLFALTSFCQNTSTTSIEKNYKKQDSIGKLFVNYILQEKNEESYNLMEDDFKKKYNYETYLTLIKPIGELRENYGSEARGYRAGMFFETTGKEISYFKYSLKGDTSKIPIVVVDICYDGRDSFKIKGLKKTVRLK